jgi:selenocysteine lyase/cysteine desulfurase
MAEPRKEFAMTIADVRNEFPALQNQVFLDSACFSLAPQRSIDKVCAFLDMAASWPSGSASQQHLDMDAMRSAARPPLAKLINATEDDIALMESTTHVALLNFPQEQEVLVSSR